MAALQMAPHPCNACEVHDIKYRNCDDIDGRPKIAIERAFLNVSSKFYL